LCAALWAGLCLSGDVDEDVAALEADVVSAVVEFFVEVWSETEMEDEVGKRLGDRQPRA